MLYFFYTEKLGININELFVEFVPEPSNDDFIEGSAMDCHGSKYERNPEARKACIAKYGYKCVASGFDFEEEYVSSVKDFIEVHHLTPTLCNKN